uniref:RNase H type-1 domain-containing protein n=2 Tax=Nicotiana TaxID=4085 RepID=A0A1S3YS34_TOBAC|nr:PREDICTED: uncharacterized protein LOC104244671 [Nicotiana sylvestris]XP_016454862.1 PREDICTED: uncharacterized protein LOC107779035 [Nicotiana tabacum]
MAVEFKLLTGKENTRPEKIPINVNWNKPSRGLIKLNIGASFNEDQSLYGFGGVFKDNYGQWIVGFHGNTPGTSALQAKLMALNIGLKTAIRQGFTKLEVETDSTDVITCLDNGIILLDDIINECRLLMGQVKIQGVHHIFREANKPAHMLAKEGLSGNNNMDLNVIYYAPYFVTNILKSDYEGKTYAVRFFNKDVCSRLAAFGNKNILRGMLLVCNNQVGNAPPGNMNNIISTIS